MAEKLVWWVPWGSMWPALEAGVLVCMLSPELAWSTRCDLFPHSCSKPESPSQPFTGRNNCWMTENNCPVSERTISLGLGRMIIPENHKIIHYRKKTAYCDRKMLPWTLSPRSVFLQECISTWGSPCPWALAWGMLAGLWSHPTPPRPCYIEEIQLSGALSNCAGDHFEFPWWSKGKDQFPTAHIAMTFS